MSSKMDVTSLRKRVSGTVTTANDADYDSQRKVFYGGIDSHPAALVGVSGPDDVVAYLRRYLD